jgi:hypothetical protein
MEPGTDWSSLPEGLEIEGTTHEIHPPQDMRYSRIDRSKYFWMAMTIVAPNLQGSTVIHPTVRHPSFLSRYRRIQLRSGYSKSVYSLFVNALGHRASQTVRSSCQLVNGQALSYAT